MLSSEIMDVFEEELSSATEIHRQSNGQSDKRPNELMDALTNLCQRSIDVVFQLDKESGCSNDVLQRFIRLQEGFCSLLASVCDRSDLQESDDQDLIDFEDHTRKRIHATLQTMKEREEQKQFIHSHVYASMRRPLAG